MHETTAGRTFDGPSSLGNCKQCGDQLCVAGDEIRCISCNLPAVDHPQAVPKRAPTLTPKPKKEPIKGPDRGPSANKQLADQVKQQGVEIEELKKRLASLEAGAATKKGK